MKEAQRFWQWFADNESRLRAFDGPAKEDLLDEIQEHLHAYCASLWFEIGGHPEGPIELIISAEGDPEYFPDVRRLMAVAPCLDGWRFVGFKPPNGFGFVTEYEGITLSPASAWFLPLFSSKYPENLGLRVAYSHYSAEQEEVFRRATLIVLDAGLGEVVAAEEIQHVEVCCAPDVPGSAGFQPLTELPAYLAARRR